MWPEFIPVNCHLQIISVFIIAFYILLVLWPRFSACGQFYLRVYFRVGHDVRAQYRE